MYQFLRERGTQTPLVAVQAAFPQLRRVDLSDLVRRYRRLGRRKRERLQSRLEWRRPGAVWAADFKERREPIEGRYGWILSIKDLASRYQLTWQPVAEATAEVVQNAYARLFDEHGPPLVLKSDNGSQFKADETKRMLAAYDVVPLFSPRRHPQYNGGVERANGQLSGYQEALAEFHGRPRARGVTMPKARRLGQRTRAPQRLARTDGRPVVVRPRAAQCASAPTSWPAWRRAALPIARSGTLPRTRRLRTNRHPPWIAAPSVTRWWRTISCGFIRGASHAPPILRSAHGAAQSERRSAHGAGNNLQRDHATSSRRGYTGVSANPCSAGGRRSNRALSACPLRASFRVRGGHFLHP